MDLGSTPEQEEQKFKVILEFEDNLSNPVPKVKRIFKGSLFLHVSSYHSRSVYKLLTSFNTCLSLLSLPSLGMSCIQSFNRHLSL